MKSEFVYQVQLSKRAERNLAKVPLYITLKLEAWVQAVLEYGLPTVKKVPGFHDEPLQGKRLGQRSIRLNKAYRAIYQEKSNQEIYLIEIVEVNKHEY